MGTRAEAEAALNALLHREQVRHLGGERPFLIFHTEADACYVQFATAKDDGALFIDVPAGSCEGRRDLWEAKLALIPGHISYPLVFNGEPLMPHVFKTLEGVEEALNLLDAFLALHGRQWTVATTEADGEA